jgi:glycosyltransferase involved in cell wall biosynthesis
MELSKLKICFLAGTLGSGGAERQLFYILRALHQQGADLRLLCLGRDEFWEGPVKELGVPVCYVGRAKFKLGRLLQIVRELRRNPPTIFQSQHFYTSAYVGAAARFLRLPGIGALRSNGLMDVQDSGPIGAWLSLHTPRVMVANSNAAIRYAKEYGVPPKRLYFLQNVVDTDHLRPGARRGESPVRLIAVGSLVQCKRFDRFLTTLAMLRREAKTPVTGVIVGSGPLRDELENQAKALGLLPSGVEFKGSIADIAPVYREADICVLTSDYEGTPNVLLEAMASGLPVVATKVGGVPELIKDGENGFMLELSDKAGFHAALAKLIADPEARIQMGHCARSFVEKNHRIEVLPEKLLALYRFVLSTRQSGK